MHVLVIGATGSLGYSTVNKLLQAGHQPRILVRNPQKVEFDSRVEVVIGDAAIEEDVQRAVRGCEALFYCVNPPITQWNTQLVPLLSTSLAACREVDAKLIFPGNVWVFGKGQPGVTMSETHPYTPCSRKGHLRMTQEQLIKESGTRFAIVRLPEFYGPHLGSSNRIMGEPFRNALLGKPIVWVGGHLDVQVEYVFMEDAAQAMVEVGLADDSDGETFHVPGYSSITPRQFFTEVVRIAGTGSKVKTIHPQLIKFMGLFDEVVREFIDIQHLWSEPILLDGTKYRQRFGQIPQTPYTEGIHRTLAWFNQQLDGNNSSDRAFVSSGLANG